MTAKRELTILQINDTHGYLNAHQEMFWAGNHSIWLLIGTRLVTG